jgi:hypothetical protein
MAIDEPPLLIGHEGGKACSIQALHEPIMADRDGRAQIVAPPGASTGAPLEAPPGCATARLSRRPG